jgi:hypothetical protein
MLIVLGLTLATTIITAALATGDTIALSARAEVLGALGNIDEVISATEESDVEITGEAVALAYFDESARTSGARGSRRAEPDQAPDGAPR